MSGPIKAALKRLSRPAVTPGAIGVLSASSASLLFRRTSAALSSVIHVAINVRPPSITTWPVVNGDTMSLTRLQKASSLVRPFDNFEIKHKYLYLR